MSEHKAKKTRIAICRRCMQGIKGIGTARELEAVARVHDRECLAAEAAAQAQARNFIVAEPSDVKP